MSDSSSQSSWRIEVRVREDLGDPEARDVLRAARRSGLPALAGLRAVTCRRGFLLPAALERTAIDRVLPRLLCDPVAERAAVYGPGEPIPAEPAGVRFDVRRRHGVMDPVAASLDRALRLLGLPAGPTGCYRTFVFHGVADRDALLEFARRELANETVDEILHDPGELRPFGTSPAYAFQRVEVALAGLDDDGLRRVERQYALSLNAVEMRAIQAHFDALGRAPTDCELLMLAQTWSEHCKHKTLTGPILFQHGDAPPTRIENLLRETIVAATHAIDAPWCLSVFRDNAGVIALDEQWALTFKVETHNHPSAIEPYGGAGTGIGGVLRDTLGTGLGAWPVASTDVFCVGPLDLPREALPKGCLHPRRVLEGVVAGVRDYGNRMGIPTVNGAVYVHEGYVGNPLVYAGSIGILPRDRIHKEVHAGDLVVVVGGRTGRDGLGGATFSSAVLTDESEVVSATAVQIGDPITEKKLADTLVQARDRGLYRCVTDCGAGGLSSAVGEMGEELGAEVELARVPLKYAGLSYAEIWLSEAQERMVLAVPPENEAELLALFAAEEVEATVIGRFTGDRVLRLRYEGALVCELDVAFLHDGLPRIERRATHRDVGGEDPAHELPTDLGPILEAILGAPNVCSKEWIVRTYDHEVQGSSVVKPLVGPGGFGPGDAAVLAPRLGSRAGFAVGCGTNPHYAALDPWAMAAAAIDEALRNVVAVGGDPRRTAILDNFSWGNCNRPERLGALVRASQACREVAVAYGTPFISGKDSLNNEFRDGERVLVIPDTLLISAISVLPDVARSCTMDLKHPGGALWVVGTTRRELGGSHYFQVRGLPAGRSVPVPRLDEAPRTFLAMHRAIVFGCVAACHDASEGGLATALAEMALAGGRGARVDARAVPTEGELRIDHVLFSESCSRFVVEVREGREAEFEEALGGVPAARFGEVIADERLEIVGPDGRPVVSTRLEALTQAFRFSGRAGGPTE